MKFSVPKNLSTEKDASSWLGWSPCTQHFPVDLTKTKFSRILVGIGKYNSGDFNFSPKIQLVIFLVAEILASDLSKIVSHYNVIFLPSIGNNESILAS